MLLDFLVAFGGDRHHKGAAGLAFLNIGNHLIVRGALRGNHDHGEALVEQRDGPVLHFAGGIRLGMQVGNLFELQRALVANGGTNATANEQGVLRIFACKRRFFDSARVGQDLFNVLCGIGHLAEQHANLSRRKTAAQLAEQHREQRERRHLAQEALRCRHGDFLVCLDVNYAVALARHGTAHHIGDAEHLRALDACIANGGQRICRLARLGHGDHKR